MSSAVGLGRIFLSWKDVCHAEEGGSRAEGPSRPAGAVAPAEYPTKYRSGTDGAQAGRGRQKSSWRRGAQAEIDGGEAPGVTIEENEEIRRLREDVAILKAATTFFVGELTPRNG